LPHRRRQVVRIDRHGRRLYHQCGFSQLKVSIFHKSQKEDFGLHFSANKSAFSYYPIVNTVEAITNDSFKRTGMSTIWFSFTF
jgi:hypothetical protein